jgi:hypothetical protein
MLPNEILPNEILPNKTLPFESGTGLTTFYVVLGKYDQDRLPSDSCPIVAERLPNCVDQFLIALDCPLLLPFITFVG